MSHMSHCVASWNYCKVSYRTTQATILTGQSGSGGISEHRPTRRLHTDGRLRRPPVKRILVMRRKRYREDKQRTRAELRDMLSPLEPVLFCPPPADTGSIGLAFPRFIADQPVELWPRMTQAASRSPPFRLCEHGIQLSHEFTLIGGVHERFSTHDLE